MGKCAIVAQRSCKTFPCISPAMRSFRLISSRKPRLPKEKQCRLRHNIVVIAAQEHRLYEEKCTTFRKHCFAYCLPIKVRSFLKNNSFEAFKASPQLILTRNYLSTTIPFVPSSPFYLLKTYDYKGRLKIKIVTLHIICNRIKGCIPILLITRQVSMNKEQSVILKGVAILMMLFLHLFNHPQVDAMCTPLLYIGSTPLVYFLSHAAHPVAIFLIISGYGLHYIYTKGQITIKGQIKKLCKLYIFYWLTLLIFVSIGHWIGKEGYPGDWETAVLNAIGLRSNYNTETWFLFPYALLSLSAFYLFKGMRKIGVPMSILTSGALYLASIYTISRYIAPNGAYGTWAYFVCIYFDLLLPFMIGAALHHIGTTHQLRIAIFSQHQWLVYILLLGLIVIDCSLSNAITNLIFEIALAVLFLQIRIVSAIKSFLSAMGKQSMVMWLIHTYFCNYFFHDFIYGFKYPIIIYATLLVISYCTSLLISFCGNKLIHAIPWLRR